MKSVRVLSFISENENKILSLILILAVIFRLAVALAMGDKVEVLPGIYDQVSYDKLAQSLVSGRGFTFDTDWWPVTRAGEPTAHWSYLMSFFLFAVYKLFGVHPLIARLLQATLAGIFMPWLTFRITQRVFQKNVSTNTFQPQVLPLIATAWIAIYGYFVYYAAALMTETFHILAILWSLDCTMRIVDWQESAKVGQSAPAKSHSEIWLWLELGVAIGIAALMRQAYLIFVPFLLLWLWWARVKGLKTPIKFPFPPDIRQQIKRLLTGSILTILVFSVFIIPFTVFNYLRFKRFVLLNDNAGYAFFWSNHPIYGYKFIPLLTPDMPTYQDLIPKDLLKLDEAALDQALMKLGIGFVLANPGRFLILSLSRIPDQFLFWPLPNSPLPSNLTRVESLGVALPFSLIGIGIWISDLWRKKLDKPLFGALLLLFFVIYTGVYIVSWAGIRYRLPVDPVLVMFASYGLFRILEKIWIGKVINTI